MGGEVEGRPERAQACPPSLPSSRRTPLSFHAPHPASWAPCSPLLSSPWSRLQRTGPWPLLRRRSEVLAVHTQGSEIESILPKVAQPRWQRGPGAQAL